MFCEENSCLIIETLFDDPDEEHYIRGLAEETGLAPSTVSRRLEELKKDGIVEIDEEGVRNRVKARKNNRKFKALKRSHNLYRVSESGLVEELMDNLFPEAVILFGSYSRGEDRKNSDIDIAVVNGREETIEKEKFEERFNREINIHNVNLEKAGDNFIETLANGITLRGHLEI